MLREVRTLRLQEERHPEENDVWQAYQYANEKQCIVELEWFVPHYGLKKWVIEPENSIEDLLRNLHIMQG
jgi:hypothetical protein